MDSLQATAQAGVTIRNLGPWTASLWGRYFGPRTLVEDASVKSNSTTVFNAQVTWQANPQFHYRRARLLAHALGGPAQWKDRLVTALERRNVA